MTWQQQHAGPSSPPPPPPPPSWWHHGAPAALAFAMMLFIISAALLTSVKPAPGSARLSTAASVQPASGRWPKSTEIAPPVVASQYECASGADCGDGSCLSGKCHCKPGFGGARCAFSAKTVFKSAPNPFAGFNTSGLLRPRDMGGWSPSAEVYVNMSKLVPAPGPQLVVEVGVWKGLSASYLAGHLKSQGRGVLVAVDTWLGALEFWTKRIEGENDPGRDLHLKHGYPTVYYSFLSNMYHEGLTDYVVPFPVPSRLAFDFLVAAGVKADLVHIDAAHEYDDVREDIRMWWQLVAPGGVLMGDDYIPGWAGVMKAADEFAAAHKLELIVIGVKWALRKPAHAPA